MNKTIKRFHIYFTFNIFFINYLPYNLYNFNSISKKKFLKITLLKILY